MDNPFYTIDLKIERLQDTVDTLLAILSVKKSEPSSGNNDDVRFTRAELAEYLKCSLGTIDRYKRNNVIPYIQAGRTLLFSKKEVDKALASDQKKKGTKSHE